MTLHRRTVFRVAPRTPGWSECGRGGRAPGVVRINDAGRRALAGFVIWAVSCFCLGRAAAPPHAYHPPRRSSKGKAHIHSNAPVTPSSTFFLLSLMSSRPSSLNCKPQAARMLSFNAIARNGNPCRLIRRSSSRMRTCDCRKACSIDAQVGGPCSVRLSSAALQLKSPKLDPLHHSDSPVRCPNVRAVQAWRCVAVSSGSPRV
jgi:hypothetical protein